MSCLERKAARPEQLPHPLFQAAAVLRADAFYDDLQDRQKLPFPKRFLPTFSREFAERVRERIAQFQPCITMWSSRCRLTPWSDLETCSVRVAGVEFTYGADDSRSGWNVCVPLLGSRD